MTSRYGAASRGVGGGAYLESLIEDNSSAEEGDDDLVTSENTELALISSSVWLDRLAIVDRVQKPGDIIAPDGLLT